MTQKIGDNPARRCDAKCYNAKHLECHCICGGTNHGAGIEQASKNVSQVFLPMVGEYGLQLGKFMQRKITEERQQMPLPLQQ